MSANTLNSRKIGHLEELLQTCSPEEWAAMISELHDRYVCYLAEDPDRRDGSQESSRIYYLQYLREWFRAMSDN